MENSVEFLLRHNSSCADILQYLYLSLTDVTIAESAFDNHFLKVVVGVITEFMRVSIGNESTRSPSSNQFHRMLPWLMQRIFQRLDRDPDVTKTIALWEDAGYITRIDRDIILNPDKFKIDNFKTIDIEEARAGTLCAALTAHLRLSHGDYNDILFRNVDDVVTAYREVKPHPGVDVEDFIRNFS